MTAQSRKRISYKHYLRSSAWATIRESALTRANRQCEWCGALWSAYILHVHHKTYARFGGDELPGDLQVLCEMCHGEAHGRPYSVLRRTERGEKPATTAKAVKKLRKANHWARIRKVREEREANAAGWVGVSIKDRY